MVDERQNTIKAHTCTIGQGQVKRCIQLSMTLKGSNDEGQNNTLMKDKTTQ